MPYHELTLEEVADYLHVSTQNVEQLVRRKEIPFERRGERLIFRSEEIDAWASARLLGMPDRQLTDYHKASSAKEHILSSEHAIMPELIRESFIQPAMRSKTKSSIIRDMVDLANKTERLNYPDDLRQAIEEREKLCSTALAGGIALLHAKNHVPYLSEDAFVVLGRTVQPVPFGSPDGQTTDLFFLLCSQDERTHLHVLARICMMCYHTNLLIQLREATDAATMLDAILASEKQVIQEL